MKIRYLTLLTLIFLIPLTSCSMRKLTDVSVIAQEESVIPSATLSPTKKNTPTNTPTPTVTPTKTVTPTFTSTPWELDSFTSSLISPYAQPVTYIEDTCAYLENKWGEGKSTPGTIVVPIMFHSILKSDREATDPNQMTKAYFEYFMGYAQKLGFETITTAELVAFLEENEAIPERAMILILDDRRPDTPELFMPYLEANNWTLTLAWPTTEATSDRLWQKIEDYVDTGFVEVQPHGHYHIYIQDYTPVEEIETEIYQPIEVIQTHFGTASSAFVWPGGNFTELAVEMAREAGYEIGFTAYSRGPLMFNWIPLGEIEMTANDPLMVLPRFWSTEAHLALDEAVAIGDAAKQAAEEIKKEELLYYSLYCQSGEGE